MTHTWHLGERTPGQAVGVVQIGDDERSRVPVTGTLEAGNTPLRTRLQPEGIPGCRLGSLRAELRSIGPIPKRLRRRFGHRRRGRGEPHCRLFIFDAAGKEHMELITPLRGGWWQFQYEPERDRATGERNGHIWLLQEVQHIPLWRAGA